MDTSGSSESARNRAFSLVKKKHSLVEFHGQNWLNEQASLPPTSRPFVYHLSISSRLVVCLQVLTSYLQQEGDEVVVGTGEEISMPQQTNPPLESHSTDVLLL